MFLCLLDPWHRIAPNNWQKTVDSDCETLDDVFFLIHLVTCTNEGCVFLIRFI